MPIKYHLGHSIQHANAFDIKLPRKRARETAMTLFSQSFKRKRSILVESKMFLLSPR